MEAVVRLSKLPMFRGIHQAVAKNKDIKAWVESDLPETNVPVLWDDTKELSEYLFPDIVELEGSLNVQEVSKWHVCTSIVSIATVSLSFY